MSFDEKFFDYLETNYKQYCLETNLQDIKNLLDYLDNEYYNKEYKNVNDILSNDCKLISDSIYDYISEYYYNTSKKNKTSVGFPINSREKIKLPHFMGSMEKIKPNTSEFDSFFKKYTNDKCISEKLDGISILLEFNNLGLSNVYTRGDGFYGKKINHIKNFINFYTGNIQIFTTENICVRGELIIRKNNWDIITKQYKLSKKNARNFISGFTNRKEFTEQDKPLMKYIDFVAFELIHPNMNINQEQQLLFLQHNFKIVQYEIVSNENCKNSNFLIDKLREYRDKSFYEIDGIIIQDNKYYSKTQENPKHSKAFKNDDDCSKINSSVIDIEWNVSKDGLLKPVIIIDTIHLDGVDISRVTGNNAKFIIDNNIGYGTIVSIIRSGGVIPKIVDVINSNSSKVVYPKVPWEWDKNKVEFVSIQKNNKEIIIKQIEYFVITMGIEFFKISTIIKSFNQNIVMSIDDLYTLTLEKLIQIEGIKEKSAQKILNSIHSKLSLKIGIDEIGLLASATPYFKGMGTKRLELIFKTYPNILEEMNPKSKIIHLNGFSDTLTNIFTENLSNFKEFLVRNRITYHSGDNNDKLSFKTKVVFSGFRDKHLKQRLINSGNFEVCESLTKTTDFLVVKSDVTNLTEKMKKAKEKGVKIITVEELILLI